ncbi:putative adhesin, partial [Zooshikella harenae]|nr:hypothetical protein [Zooshikella harenae]
FYDPDVGRFLSMDAWEGDLTLAPSLHKYLYAYGNPLVWVDLDGNEVVYAHESGLDKDYSILNYFTSVRAFRKDMPMQQNLAISQMQNINRGAASIALSPYAGGVLGSASVPATPAVTSSFSSMVNFGRSAVQSARVFGQDVAALGFTQAARLAFLSNAQAANTLGTAGVITSAELATNTMTPLEVPATAAIRASDELLEGASKLFQGTGKQATKIIGEASDDISNVTNSYVVSGHGIIGPNPPSIVPHGSSVTVYTPPGGTITNRLGNYIEEGGDTTTLFKYTYNAGDEIPEIIVLPAQGGTYHGVNFSSVDIKGNPITVEEPTKLVDLLKANEGNCKLATCLDNSMYPHSNVVATPEGLRDRSSGDFLNPEDIEL